MRRVVHFILIKSCTERLASHKSCWLELLPVSMAEPITVNENRIPMISQTICKCIPGLTSSDFSETGHAKQDEYMKGGKNGVLGEKQVINIICYTTLKLSQHTIFLVQYYYQVIIHYKIKVQCFICLLLIVHLLHKKVNFRREGALSILFLVGTSVSSRRLST